MEVLKKFAFLVCALAFAIQGHSQVTFGAKAGTTHSFFFQDYNYHPGYLGPRGGAFVDYGLGTSLLLHGSVEYALYRGSLDAAPSLNSSSVVIRSNIFFMNMAEASGLLYYKLPLAFLGTTGLSLGVGGAAGYNFFTLNRTRSTHYNQSGSVVTVSAENVTSSFNPFLYSGLGGLRLEFPQEGKLSAVFLDARAAYTFNEVMVISGYPAYSNGRAADIRLMTLSIQVGVKF